MPSFNQQTTLQVEGINSLLFTCTSTVDPATVLPHCDLAETVTPSLVSIAIAILSVYDLRSHVWNGN